MLLRQRRNVQGNVYLLKSISVKVLDMLKLIAVSLVAIPALLMLVGLIAILKSDSRTTNGYKRKSKN